MTMEKLHLKEEKLKSNIALLIGDQDEETTIALWNEVACPSVYTMASFNEKTESVAPSLIVYRTREGFDLEDYIDIDLLASYIVDIVSVDKLVELDVDDFIGLESLIEDVTGIQL